MTKTVKKVKQRKINWKTLVKTTDKEHREDIVVYEFFGRKFVEKQNRPY